MTARVAKTLEDITLGLKRINAAGGHYAADHFIRNEGCLVIDDVGGAVWCSVLRNPGEPICIWVHYIVGPDSISWMACIREICNEAVRRGLDTTPIYSIGDPRSPLATYLEDIDGGLATNLKFHSGTVLREDGRAIRRALTARTVLRALDRLGL